jgi:branched-chain amino acid transport system permease protein
MDAFILSQYVLSGLVIGVIYALMALGITFIYSIMKMINWSMGEFYMIGSYVQYALLASVLGWSLWWVALPLSMVSVFPSASSSSAFRCGPCTWAAWSGADEYATIVTIALMVLFRNLAIVLGGGPQSTRRGTTRPRRRC